MSCSNIVTCIGEGTNMKAMPEVDQLKEFFYDRIDYVVCVCWKGTCEGDEIIYIMPSVFLEE